MEGEIRVGLPVLGSEKPGRRTLSADGDGRADRKAGELAPGNEASNCIGIIKRCQLGKISILSQPKREFFLLRLSTNQNCKKPHQSQKTVAGQSALPVLHFQPVGKYQLIGHLLRLQPENVMHYLLLIGAMLWLLFLAPLKVTLLTAISVAVITALIRHLAYSMNGVTVSFGDAAKAIGNSFIFLVVSVFTLLSFLKGSGVTHISGLPGLAVLGAFLAAYVLGFQVSLRLSFGASSAIALASTVASTGAFFLARSIL